MHPVIYEYLLKYRKEFGPKILANSIPKAGTNLLLQVFHNIDYLRYYTDSGVDYLMKPEDVCNILSKLGRGEYIYGHLAYDKSISEFLDTRSIRQVLIVRDPRDITVSQAFYLSKRPENRLYEHFSNLKTVRERIIAAIKGVPDNLPSIAEQYQIYAPWLHDKSCLVVKFEDIVGIQGGGNDQSRLETTKSIIKHVGIRLSKKNLSKLADSVFNNSSPTFRKGQIGNWQEWLDAEMIEMFERDKDIYRAFGYFI